jgi:hypothetical protein
MYLTRVLLPSISTFVSQQLIGQSVAVASLLQRRGSARVGARGWSHGSNLARYPTTPLQRPFHTHLYRTAAAAATELILQGAL